MNVRETGLKDCFIIEPKVFLDERGYFVESYNKKTLLIKIVHLKIWTIIFIIDLIERVKVLKAYCPKVTMVFFKP